MADIDSLTSKFNTIKLNFDMIYDFIASFPEQGNIVALKSRKQRLIELNHQWDSNFVELEVAKPGEFKSEYCKYSNLYWEIIDHIDTILDCTNVSPSVPQTNCSGKIIEVKLPDIALPSFNGDYGEWPQFIDIYNSLIHNNSRLSDVQKLHYLKGALVKSASNLISTLQLTNENYVIAYNLLIKTYDNKFLIINSHLQYLDNIVQLHKGTHESLSAFLNNARQHVQSLKAAHSPAEHWDLILLYLLMKKIDTNTRLAWNLSRTNNDLPSLNSFFSFLEQRVIALENSFKLDCSKQSKAVHLNTTQRPIALCLCCEGKHILFKCPKFKELEYKARNEIVVKNSICPRCLQAGHKINKCNYKGKCLICHEPHNTLLHRNSTPVPSTNTSVSSTSALNSGNVLFSSNSNIQTLLSTVSLTVQDINGKEHCVRALLDSGSQINLITNSLALKLQCPTVSAVNKMHMLQGQTCISRYATKVQIKSRISAFQRTIHCVVVQNITQNIPSTSIDFSAWNIPSHIHLADPDFNIASPVEILIGAELYFDILQQGCIRLGQSLPILRKSRFGWLLSGVYESSNSSQYVGLISNAELHNSLNKFWELEEVDCDNAVLKGSDKECEDSFIANSRQTGTGSFEVALPFISNKIDNLGSSFQQAKLRLENLERRLLKDPLLGKAYSKFIKEYIDLGHAEPINLDKIPAKSYFLPHHPVLKENNYEKIRVVFDASSKSSTGLSLNDVLHTGPKLQQDLFSILLRFRCQSFVFVADIIKMYRQIRIRESDQYFQLILWRNSPTERITTYKLTTVTYGTSCAPFLAMRCVKQLATNNELCYKQAAHILKRDCYVDDVITGCNSVTELLVLQKQLVALLQKGNFKLHKWASNCRELLEALPKEAHNLNTNFTPDKDTIKTLGLTWNPMKDIFKIDNTNIMSSDYAIKAPNTKRIILSKIAQIYDPIGLIAPITITAKLIIQKLWREKIDWDDALPEIMQNEWERFRNGLTHLHSISINRCVFRTKPTTTQLHGFADASLKAYGACIYLRATYADGGISSHLLCSKSRVAPLKNVTLPRLELSGALLLAKLYKQVLSDIENVINCDESFLWTDSSIVLAWLRTDPAQLKMFVSNRVSAISELTPGSLWRHVSSKDNPADIVSRGVDSAIELRHCDLWWYGPPWLVNDQDRWPNKFADPNPDVIPEKRVLLTRDQSITDQYQQSFFNNFYSKFSSFNTLIRVTAYCLRWIPKYRRILSWGTQQSLSTEELSQATKFICRLIQLEAFSEVVDQVQSCIMTAKMTHKLKVLNPFLDSEGLLRVGGRLENAKISFEQKHPIILPKDHTIVQLLLRYEHERLLHAGAQTVLANIRLRYWPLGGRNAVKKVIRNCVKCTRFRAVTAEQIMGNLPKDRITKIRPFQNVGVDFAGPIILGSSRLRKAPCIKAYIALFVCMVTKAIHIELVTSLSTDAFLAALKRFVSRRGCCSVIHSDNGKSFVGARKELAQLYQFFKGDITRKKLVESASTLGIRWQFIPSYSPHFGGLWEGSIKSMKHHIRRVIGSYCLTYEEYMTVLTQIEAVLNSRPLLATTDDSSDVKYISPGHFLIGEALSALPEPYILDGKVNSTKLFKQLTAIRDQFWTIWSKHYLSSLHHRNKWSKIYPNLKLNSVVLIKDDNSPPLQWPIGRIIDIKTGEDGKVRVVTVKTNNGSYIRPIVKIVPLPCE